MTSRQMDEQKPLFNRTYLKLLPVILGAVIVWLTYQYRHQNAPEIEEWTPHALYATQVDTLQGIEVSLVYPIPSALTLPATIERTALEIALEQSIDHQSDIEVHWSEDKAILILRYPDEASFDPSQTRLTVDHLINQVQEHYFEAKQRAAAEIYLEQQNVQERALLNATSQFAQPQPESNIGINNLEIQPRVVISAAHLSSALKDKAQALVDPSLAMLPAGLEHSGSSSDISLPQKVRIQANTPLALILQPIERSITAQKDSPLNRFDDHIHALLITHILAQVMDRLPLSEGASYRVIYRPTWPVGYQGLLLTRPTPITEESLTRVRNFTQKSIDQNLIDTVIVQLVDQYRTQLETPEQRTRLINEAIFYGWTLPAVTEFKSMLESIDQDAIKAAVQARLSPEQSLTVWVP